MSVLLTNISAFYNCPHFFIGISVQTCVFLAVCALCVVCDCVFVYLILMFCLCLVCFFVCVCGCSCACV